MDPPLWDLADKRAWDCGRKWKGAKVVKGKWNPLFPPPYVIGSQDLHKGLTAFTEALKADFRTQKLAHTAKGKQG